MVGLANGSRNDVTRSRRYFSAFTKYVATAPTTTMVATNSRVGAPTIQIMPIITAISTSAVPRSCCPTTSAITRPQTGTIGTSRCFHCVSSFSLRA